MISQETYMQIWPQVIHHLCVFRKNHMLTCTCHTAVSVIPACPRHMYCLFSLYVFSLCPFLRLLFFFFTFSLCESDFNPLECKESFSPAGPQPRLTQPHSLKGEKHRWERKEGEVSVGEKRGGGIGGREERGRCWKRVEEVERKCWRKASSAWRRVLCK